MDAAATISPVRRRKSYAEAVKPNAEEQSTAETTEPSINSTNRVLSGFQNLRISDTENGEKNAGAISDSVAGIEAASAFEIAKIAEKVGEEGGEEFQPAQAPIRAQIVPAPLPPVAVIPVVIPAAAPQVAPAAPALPVVPAAPVVPIEPEEEHAHHQTDTSQCLHPIEESDKSDSAMNTAEQSSSTMNSTSSIISAGAVEAAVARLVAFNNTSVGLMTLDKLVNFADDCDVLLSKSRFNEPDLLNKTIRILGEGIVAVTKTIETNRLVEGPSKEWESFLKVFSPLTISYNLLKMRPGSIQAMTPKDHQDLFEFNQEIGSIYVKNFF